MRGINSLFLLGTVRDEPEQLASEAGKNYIRFEMDVKAVRKTNGMDEEVRELIPVVAFEKLGEIVSKYVAPKHPLSEAAHISTNEFRTDTGVTRRSITIVADSVQMLPNCRKEDRAS
jgi:single-stranded DNA-binding protein